MIAPDWIINLGDFLLTYLPLVGMLVFTLISTFAVDSASSIETSNNRINIPFISSFSIALSVAALSTIITLLSFQLNSKNLTSQQQSIFLVSITLLICILMANLWVNKFRDNNFIFIPLSLLFIMISFSIATISVLSVVH